MFVNSLFKDYLEENGLTNWKNESTRDLICLEFNYGSRSYRQEVEHLYKVAKSAKRDYYRARSKNDNYLMDKYSSKIKKISDLLIEAKHNKLKYHSLSNESIRKLFYESGVDVEYITRKRNGEIIKTETIHYKMLYRSTGKAKKGSCMFINEKLYKKAINFLYMGIKLPKENPMIVEISAYAPLVSSGIVDKIQINPRNILVMKDIDVCFNTNVISVETDKDRHCIAKYIEDYKLKNTIFDGQALIDSSIFPSWGNGYILLRHHFCKMAAFSTNIQKFFKDYFKDRYETAIIKDMFGQEHYVKDIELITTDNAMKWIKFNITYGEWCKWVNDNGNNFGIVKTAHESKLGNMQKMSYQMVNSLDELIMEHVVEESVEYVNKLKQDDEFFLGYLKDKSNFSNDYDVLIALCNHNPEFIRSSYFRERKKDIIKTYVLNMKSGEIMNNADNLTIVGSPYAMLLYSATGNPESIYDDDTFMKEDNTIQCYTERFKSNEYLAFFRSPFNSKNNLTYLHNMYCRNIERYFNLGRQCIAVNMIGTDFQDRNNGADQDSDFGYTTNNSYIVEHARKCYLDYPTIVNNIPKDQNTYSNTMSDYAKIDNGLARSQRTIGESSNLAQICQSYSCTFHDQKYKDNVCILSVLAQVAIDNAKRSFDIDLVDEIRRIKADMDVIENKYPKFWSIVKPNFNKQNINDVIHCPMNYLSDISLPKFRNSKPTLPMDYFFIKHNLDKDKKQCKKVEELITKYSFSLYNAQISKDVDEEEMFMLRSDLNTLIDDIKKVYISTNRKGMMSWLIDRAFVITPKVAAKAKFMKTNLHKNRAILLKVLYEVGQKSFLECFKSGVLDPNKI